MKRQLLFWLWLCPVLATAQPPAPYPKEVEMVLQKSGSNRTELEKAIDHFLKQGDGEKIRAIEFLVSNMDVHSSSNYYWADSTGKRVNFNENLV